MVDGQSLKMIQSQWPDPVPGVPSPGPSLGVLRPGGPSHLGILQVLTDLVVLGDLHAVDPVLLRRAAVVSHLVQVCSMSFLQDQANSSLAGPYSYLAEWVQGVQQGGNPPRR